MKKYKSVANSVLIDYIGELGFIIVLDVKT